MQGQCLCQAVTITTPDTHDIHACHCRMCRTWSGGAGFAFAAPVPEIQGAEHIRHYQSSEWAERAFCAQCGTHLYYHLIGTPQYYLYAGVFADAAFTLTSQIYIDCQADYAALAAKTPQLTEAEFLASIAEPPENDIDNPLNK